MKVIGVAGAGAWGVALANAAAAAGRTVVLWGRDGAPDACNRSDPEQRASAWRRFGAPRRGDVRSLGV